MSIIYTSINEVIAKIKEYGYEVDGADCDVTRVSIRLGSYLTPSGGMMFYSDVESIWIFNRVRIIRTKMSNKLLELRINLKDLDRRLNRFTVTNTHLHAEICGYPIKLEENGLIPPYYNFLLQLDAGEDCNASTFEELLLSVFLANV
jgi:hypothetical protein